eukprot:2997732-Pleurochrysis_carterae.AAC.1
MKTLALSQIRLPVPHREWCAKEYAARFWDSHFYKRKRTDQCIEKKENKQHILHREFSKS